MLAQRIRDRNTVAHLALEHLLANLTEEQSDMFDVRLQHLRIESEQPVHEVINTWSAEIIDVDGTFGIESMDHRVENYIEGTEATEAALDIAPQVDIEWAGAKAGWELIKNWVNKQREIDGDSVQVDEILEEWRNGLSASA